MNLIISIMLMTFAFYWGFKKGFKKGYVIAVEELVEKARVYSEKG